MSVNFDGCRAGWWRAADAEIVEQNCVEPAPKQNLANGGNTRDLNLSRVVTILALGLVGWALCGAIMFVGMTVTSLQTTLIAHAIGAPIIFAAISWFYFTRLDYTAPLATAIAFLLIVMAMDFFLVALVINRSLEMFQSLERGCHLR